MPLIEDNLHEIALHVVALCVYPKCKLKLMKSYYMLASSIFVCVRKLTLVKATTC